MNRSNTALTGQMLIRQILNQDLFLKLQSAIFHLVSTPSHNVSIMFPVISEILSIFNAFFFSFSLAGVGRNKIARA